MQTSCIYIFLTCINAHKIWIYIYIYPLCNAIFIVNVRTLLHRDYVACARLVGSVGFDEGISPEELRLLKMLLMETAKALATRTT